MLFDWLWDNVVYYWSAFMDQVFWPVVDWFKEHVAVMVLCVFLVIGWLVHVIGG